MAFLQPMLAGALFFGVFAAILTGVFQTQVFVVLLLEIVVLLRNFSMDAFLLQRLFF
jgi:hypothetical protein